MKVSRLTVGKRLVLGFGILLVLSIAMGVTGYYSAESISEGSIAAFRNLLKTDAAVLEYSLRARADVLGLRRFEKDIFLNIDSKETVAKYLESWKKEKEHLIARLNDVEEAATLDQDKKNVGVMKASLVSYEKGFQEVLDRIREGKIKTPQEANTAISSHKDVIHALEQATKDFSSESSKKMAATENEIRRLANRAKRTASILMVVSVLLGTLSCIVVIRGITRLLKNIIATLNTGAGQVSVSAGQVSSASQQLAQGTSEQAASIEETSSSLEEMAAMTRQNAENATHADQLMAATSKIMSTADQSMARLTTSMNHITKASEETSKVIKTVDEIAFQTNLLALNAAVEAARAGEAGAGFAVVANEVRNLALRAADAAKNTASLIEGTMVKIEEGSGLVQTTNADFSRVATSVGKMSELIGEITAASAEQSQGIEQINRAVCEMDKVVQQNAASAEESAAASEELSAQAEQLKGVAFVLSAMVGGRNGEGKELSVPNDGDYGRVTVHSSRSVKLLLPLA